MDTFKLKILAISAMLIDHIGIVLVLPTGNYWLYFACRAVGRLAFPVFAFLIVEGFYHTRDVRRYLKRLLLFALISEIPFDLGLYRYHFNADAISDMKLLFQDPASSNAVFQRLMLHQNVFFTLFLGLLLIYLFHLVDQKYAKNDFMSVAISNMIDAFITVAFCVIAFFFKSDYDIAGILIIAAFYLFRGSKALITISLLILSGSLLCYFNSFSSSGNLLDIVGILAVLAVIPISLYNGKKGKNIKYFFYAFYPVHLFLLFLLQC